VLAHALLRPSERRRRRRRRKRKRRVGGGCVARHSED
jgi:hypothetical protein